MRQKWLTSHWLTTPNECLVTYTSSGGVSMFGPGGFAPKVINDKDAGRDDIIVSSDGGTARRDSKVTQQSAKMKSLFDTDDDDSEPEEPRKSVTLPKKSFTAQKKTTPAASSVLAAAAKSGGLFGSSSESEEEIAAPKPATRPSSRVALPGMTGDPGTKKTPVAKAVTKAPVAKKKDDLFGSSSDDDGGLFGAPTTKVALPGLTDAKPREEVKKEVKKETEKNKDSLFSSDDESTASPPKKTVEAPKPVVTISNPPAHAKKVVSDLFGSDSDEGDDFSSMFAKPVTKVTKEQQPVTKVTKEQQPVGSVGKKKKGLFDSDSEEEEVKPKTAAPPSHKKEPLFGDDIVQPDGHQEKTVKKTDPLFDFDDDGDKIAAPPPKKTITKVKDSLFDSSSESELAPSPIKKQPAVDPLTAVDVEERFQPPVMTPDPVKSRDQKKSCDQKKSRDTLFDESEEEEVKEVVKKSRDTLFDSDDEGDGVPVIVLPEYQNTSGDVPDIPSGHRTPDLDPSRPKVDDDQSSGVEEVDSSKSSAVKEVVNSNPVISTGVLNSKPAVKDSLFDSSDEEEVVLHVKKSRDGLFDSEEEEDTPSQPTKTSRDGLFEEEKEEKLSVSEPTKKSRDALFIDEGAKPVKKSRDALFDSSDEGESSPTKPPLKESRDSLFDDEKLSPKIEPIRKSRDTLFDDSEDEQPVNPVKKDILSGESSRVDLFGDDVKPSKLPELSQDSLIDKDLPTQSVTKSSDALFKESGNKIKEKDPLFDPDEDFDLFSDPPKQLGSKKGPAPSTDPPTKKGLFDSDSEESPTKPSPPKTKKVESLFDSEVPDFSPPKKSKDSLFDDTSPPKESPPSAKSSNDKISRLQGMLNLTPGMLGAGGAPPPRKPKTTSPTKEDEGEVKVIEAVVPTVVAGEETGGTAAVLSSVTKGRTRRGGRRPPTRRSGPATTSTTAEVAPKTTPLAETTPTLNPTAPAQSAPTKQPSLFDPFEEPAVAIPTSSPGPTKQPSLFEDFPPSTTAVTRPTSVSTNNKNQPATPNKGADKSLGDIFGEDDNLDLFATPPSSSTSTGPKKKTKAKKKPSLFDDDDFDLFSSTPAKVRRWDSKFLPLYYYYYYYSECLGLPTASPLGTVAERYRRH
eukprot:sb/3461338/